MIALLRKQGNEKSAMRDMSIICAIALLWLAAIVWTPPRLWNFAPSVPAFFAAPWIKVLRSRLNSLEIEQSTLILWALMSVILGLCWLILYAVPEGRLLAPWGFVALHAPLFLSKHKPGAAPLTGE